MERTATTTPVYATPTAGPETNAGRPLHPEQIRSWRENGFALVYGLFAADLIVRARAECLPFFPSPGSSEIDRAP